MEGIEHKIRIGLRCASLRLCNNLMKLVNIIHSKSFRSLITVVKIPNCSKKDFNTPSTAQKAPSTVPFPLQPPDSTGEQA